ncbi:MAG TPA: hypothetical protein VGF13_08580 [Verrucomicrobiae bacterium]|jgi:hypothetical protein
MKRFFLLTFLCFVHTGVPSAEAPLSDLKTVWGPVTNGLKAGVRFLQNGQHRVAESLQVDFLIASTQTSNIVVGLPKPEERYMIHLHDAAKREVPKTLKGKRLGQTTDAKNLRDLPQRGRLGVLLPESKSPTSLGSIKIGELFNVPKAGDYALSGDIVVFQIGENRQLRKIKIPFSAQLAIELDE